MISSARSSLPQWETGDGKIKQDRWFNIIIDDTEVLLRDLQDWKRPDLPDRKPPALVIDVYLDTVNINPNQVVVAVDGTGRRWDISDALSASSSASPSSRITKAGGKSMEVLLERWRVELRDQDSVTSAEANDPLPNVYKKGVVLFRSLYTYLRFLPAWKLYRRLGRHGANNGGLRLKWRIRQGLAGDGKGEPFPLLVPRDEAYTRPISYGVSSQGANDTIEDTETHDAYTTGNFTPLRTPAGPLHISVDYRSDCQHFDIASSEALLSSRFLHTDEGMPTMLQQAGRSLPGARTPKRDIDTSSRTAPRQPRALLGAYGSLNTFHATGKRESPVTVLRQRQSEDDVEADADTRWTPSPANFKSPFKAGSLGSSSDMYRHARSSEVFTEAVKEEQDQLKDIGRIPTHSRKPSSIQTLPQQALRVPPHSLPNETAIASSGSSSPRAPLPRYTSAFAGRTKRSSSTSQPDKTKESGGSSAKGSSSDQAASGTKSDEDDIADFIRLVESSAVKDANLTKPQPRHAVDLSRFSHLRDTSSQLSEEMESSLVLSSTTPPSRRLSNVPGLSTSSSPSSRAHAYAPPVRSRLSTQSIAEEARILPAIPADTDEGDEPFIFQTEEL
ncbi:hypothetical protein BAUCODRAFT_350618 [Baudoinia panamericana UAMH 10762]|uniref:Autophagy-related protein 13 n=1 Tax=Baudoinia panamericana (strain UAMH 10762) TaxID=717646 RepID=M2NK23_BAUPA|nr:uncharacterized protein BAUCODRAFT_350618 [Baudoinia panamericana UAMH 10762]EMC99779.1 hypothetical protein BAUCODRAFT_350618 [Baudoinia panamericana UAMH 10762]